MKKFLSFCIFILLFYSVSAGAQVNVFFQPKTGFLRVDAAITIESTATDLSFKVFPEAQITEFWIDNLNEYNIVHNSQHVEVNFTVLEIEQNEEDEEEEKEKMEEEEEDKKPTLNLSYEGFINVEEPPVLMDYGTLWFPEFSFTIQTPLIHVNLPQKWNIMSANIMDVEQNDDYSITSWKGGSVFTVKPEQEELTSSEIISNEQKTNISQELLSRIQVQVLRLTNSISDRQKEEIEIQLTDELKDSGLATYLACLPKSYGSLSSKILLEPHFLEDEFQVLLSTESGREYLANMTWKEHEGKLRLDQFRLTPYGSRVPKELNDFLDNFVKRLAYAVESKDLKRIKDFLELDYNQEQIQNLMLNLNTEENWSLQYVVTEPLSITILVPHSDNLNLLLNLGLIAGEEDWLINNFDVIPLN